MNANERPNVLLIMTDAQRRDTLGCYGNRLVRTPAIDSLAAEGVRFAEWHVPNPLCMGVRASLMTGHYPSSHGVAHQRHEPRRRAAGDRRAAR